MNVSRISPPSVPPGEPPPEASTGFPKVQGDAEQELSLADVMKILRRRRNVIFAVMGIGTAICAAVIFQITPRYTAEALVMLEARKTQVVDLQSVVSGLPADSAAIRSEVEVLRSPMIAEKVVAKLDLTALPEFNARLRHPSAFAPLIDAVHGLVAKVEPLLGIDRQQQAPDVTREQREMREAVRTLMARTDVINDGRSYVLKIRVESEGKQLAATIANAFAETYLDAQLEAKFEAVRRANAWLNEHLTDLSTKVQNTDRAVQVFKAQHNLTQTKGETVTAQQLAELNSQLILAAADRAQKDSNLRQIQDQLRSGGVAAAAQVLASPLIQKLREDETNLLTEQAQLAARYKPAHPAMINIRAQERDLERKIQDEIDKIVRGMAGEVAAARAKEATLRDSLQDLQRSTAQLDETQVQLRQLEREAESNRTLYSNFLNRFKQTSAQEDIQQADARLLSAATVPNLPTYPQTRLLLLLAIAGSGVVGLLLAFAVEQLDSGFRTSEQFERAVHVPVLGLVPNETRGNLAPIDAVIKRPVSPYAEAIRTVRTALRYSGVDNPPKVVMVTSSLPTEGKTMFSLSLARSVAFSGGRALLIDCDLRRPNVGRQLKIDAKPGLLALFEEKSDLSQVIQVDAISGLHVIPTPAGTPNPQDLLGSRRMGALLDGLREHYDMIILDTPPILAVSDALILSHLADTTMFLVRWGHTPRPVVQGALKSFRTNGGTLAGAILSRVDYRRQASYGYGDAGYYYGHYNKHYDSYGKAVKGPS